MLKKSYHRLFLREGGGGEGAKLAPIQEASIAAEELFRLSEFCTCLTELLCLTTAPFRPVTGGGVVCTCWDIRSVNFFCSPKTSILQLWMVEHLKKWQE